MLIEPGGVKTPIWAKGTAAADEMAEGMPPEAEQLYGKLMDTIRAQSPVEVATKTGIEPARWPRRSARRSPRPSQDPLPRRQDAKRRWAVAKRVPDRVMDRLIARQMG